MAEMNKVSVHASERVSARDMIQTTFEGDEDLSLMTDKDVAKMQKKAEKDERAARAALAAHQVSASWMLNVASKHHRLIRYLHFYSAHRHSMAEHGLSKSMPCVMCVDSHSLFMGRCHSSAALWSVDAQQLTNT